MRLDQFLFAQGFAQSRERAQALIMEGIVYINKNKAEKPGLRVPQDALVEIRGNSLAYVSRGGLKLEKALKIFPISPNGLVCMDVGASTGGFTDCMLQNGAKKVYAVDVGYGQLAWSLRCNLQVVVMERSNIRKITPDMLDDEIDFFSVDVSFISLQIVLPALKALLSSNAVGICLVKPQFEAGKQKVGKNGVVKDLATHKEVLHSCFAHAQKAGFFVAGLGYSPIKGPKGNIEYLMYLKSNDTQNAPDDKAIDEVCKAAHEELN